MAPTTGPLGSPILDSGVGPDENPLRGHWNGPSFGDGADLQRLSNAITSDGVFFSAGCWVATTFSATLQTLEVFATVPVLPVSGDTFRVILLSDPTSVSPNGYYIVVKPSTGAWNIERADAGSGTNVLLQSQAFSAGDAAAFTITSAGLITPYYAAAAASTWTALTAATDSTYSVSNWYAGLECEDNTQRITNFGAGNGPVGPQNQIAWIGAAG